MPWIQDSGSGSSSNGASIDDHVDSAQIINNENYPALSFPDYAEKPLVEQLEPIAVVGMGCRLPGNVNSPSQFWQLMMSKGSGQTPKVPTSRFNIDAHYHSNNERPGSFNVLGGYFLDDIQGFDPALFGISPIEAMTMDPQQRKLLEVVYEAFDSGGVSLTEISGTTTAVFIGSFTSDFQQMSFKEPDFRHSYAATGVDPGIISNRISHVFNLHGPSIAINTACSSSVYAMHNACNALRNFECSGAVVGGTNLVLTVDQHMNTAKLGVLSPTSTCHTFDESADGYGRGEAIGAVYLKRFSDAVRDGDPIRGLIRSSAVNSNGKVPAVGITYPNCQGQEDVIRHAYRRGGDLDPRLTGYFECHGTGTPVGDPIEVKAVANAMNDQREVGQEPLLIGAVKTNIGHSEAASGLSAVIKAILIVETGVIPSTRGVVELNSKIQWDKWQVQVVTEPTPFPSHLPVKRVSVNSFGYGGTNAHIIVESVQSFLPNYRHGQAKVKLRGAHNRQRPFLLLFSAHDRVTLNRNIAAYSPIVTHYNLHDLSYTLANRRTHHQSRTFAVATDTSVRDIVDTRADGFSFGEKKHAPTVGFAFTGQGAQWARMGYQLIIYYPTFMKTIRKLDFALEQLSDGPDWTLEDMLLEDAKTSRINEAEFSQPLCTAVQIAIVELLALWGVRPTVTVGHSSGEIGAAFAAGLIPATEAIIVAYYRGCVVRDLDTNGAMLAVGLGAEEVRSYLEGVEQGVVIACHNSPSSVTLSGDLDGIIKVEADLVRNGVFAKSVKTGGKAYHSHHMQQVSAKYRQMILQAKASMVFEPSLRTSATMVSSVTNSKLASDTIIDHDYWSKNLISPVLFNQAIETIATDQDFSSVDTLIEIGPHSALSGPIRQICIANGFEKLSYLPTLIRNGDAAAQLLRVAGELYLRDYKLDMKRITCIETTSPSGKIALTEGLTLVDLPTYQWNYAKTLWDEPRQSVEHRASHHDRHDILGRRVPGDSAHNPTWRNILRIRDVPWLRHHSLGGEAVFPAAGYFSMAMEAITRLNESSPEPIQIHGYVLRDVLIKAALVTPDDDKGIEVILSLQPSAHSEGQTQSASTWWNFTISSVSSDRHCIDHMTGTIAINMHARRQKPKALPNLPQRASGKSWNHALRDVGFDYGATFRDMNNIQSDGKAFIAAADTTLKQKCGIMNDESRHVLHPSTVDSCLQLIIVSIYAGRINDMACGAIPIQVEEVAIWPPSAKQLESSKASALSWTDQRGIRSFVSSSELIASDGEVLMHVTNMRCVAYEAAVPQRIHEVTESQPYMHMAWKQDVHSLHLSNTSLGLDIPTLVSLVTHKKPQARILEVGDRYAPRILATSKLLHYTIADTIDSPKESSEALPEGYQNDHVQRINLFVLLDNQAHSDTEASYDLVILPKIFQSSHVIPTIRRLLSSGGRIVFEKLLGVNVLADFLRSATLEVEFESSEFVLSKAMMRDQVSSVDVASTQILLIYRQRPDELVLDIVKATEEKGWSIRIGELNSCEVNAGEHVIVLTDIKRPMLASLSREELKAIQHIFSQASSVLWVTFGGLYCAKRPEHGMIAGLLRSIISENALLRACTMDFDLDSTLTANVVKIIVASTERLLENGDAHESEYYVANDAVYISRLEPLEDLNTSYAIGKKDAEAIQYNHEAPLVGKVQAGRVAFEVDSRTEKLLGVNEVEIRVIYAGLNKEDVAIVNGTDYASTFSHEIYGQIAKVGGAVKNLCPGDHVIGFCFDRFATIQRTSADLLQKVSDTDLPEEVATLPVAYATALHGLGNLEENDVVLILHGTGHCGIAALNICISRHAKPFIVVESPAEAEKMMANFPLAENQIIESSENSIPMRLRELTGGRGADVVFSTGSIDSGTARECWRYIAPFGRFADSGRKNVLKRNVLDSLPLHHGATYHSFDLLNLYERKPQVLTQLLRLTYSLFRQNLIPAIRPVRISHLAKLDEEVSQYSDSWAQGKLLVAYEKADCSINVLPSPPIPKFRPDATYLLVGALGGLGRSLGSWMMERGAKHFTFMARSGMDSQQAAILVADMRAAGATIQVVRGDVTVRADVDRALSGISAEFPLRGVVHAAMVLRDGLFHNMTFNDWKTSTGPKVNGALNLHEALANTPVDFFVMTSSTSGTLGTPGQSNYAAGNNFLDVLAHHRVAMGLPAVSLVLPMVLGVGYVAEHPEIEEALKRKGIYGIDEEHLLQAFEACMFPRPGVNRSPHIIVGLDPAKLQKSITASETTDGFWLEDTRFRTLLHTIQSSGTDEPSDGSDHSILASIANANSPAEAVDMVSEHFTAKLSRLLLVELCKFDDDASAPIASYGLDSMIGAELRNWIFKEYALDVPFQQLLGPTLTIRKFAALVCAHQGLLVDELES